MHVSLIHNTLFIASIEIATSNETDACTLQAVGSSIASCVVHRARPQPGDMLSRRVPSGSLGHALDGPRVPTVVLHLHTQRHEPRQLHVRRRRLLAAGARLRRRQLHALCGGLLLKRGRHDLPGVSARLLLASGRVRVFALSRRLLLDGQRLKLHPVPKHHIRSPGGRVRLVCGW